ncbi:PoNe immunity protein domain-containing protein [Acanthopleuribacter pedis]|uniref:DUF1911 domain-containing protein n=1 Tax=Acanthopleuribacter pedis TaxID=442870 RepID=A0A8J7U4S9_9BACT|nr:PoNe immunity protein domain-containing protein [Acanthopleuribacter pedis]MBO1317314.1 DUF1911 domain-containing protein [Acanthopleuribacter pedis]MBO1318621.1 DUF1911 domain-containing protein [Acanthopleuribacter pedis]
MAHRAFFASEGYFEQDVARRKKSVAEFEASVREAEENNGDTALYLYPLFIRRYKLAVSLYSAGGNLDEVKQLFAECLKALCAYQQSPGFQPLDLNDLEQYTYAVEILALGLLFDVPREWFEAVVKVVEAAPAGKTPPRDFVLDFLISCWDAGREPVETLLHPEPYEALKDVCQVENDDDRLLAVLRFLDRYREGTESLPWSQSHMDNDGQYFGFWSFALAAVVHELGFSDEAFAMNMLYPGDLAGHRDPDLGVQVEPPEITPPEIAKPSMELGVSLED